MFGVPLERNMGCRSLDLVHEQKGRQMADGPDAGAAERQLPIANCRGKFGHILDVHPCTNNEHQRYCTDARDG